MGGTSQVRLARRIISSCGAGMGGGGQVPHIGWLLLWMASGSGGAPLFLTWGAAAAAAAAVVAAAGLLLRELSREAPDALAQRSAEVAPPAYMAQVGGRWGGGGGLRHRVGMG